MDKKLVNSILNTDINDDNSKKLINKDKIIESYNKIINEHIHKKGKLTQYLGDGYQGKIFKAELQGIPVICKIINLDDKEYESKKNVKNVTIELGIIRMLTNNTKIKYLIPCLYFRMYENELYTFFPIFNGRKLIDMKSDLLKMDNIQFVKIVKLIINHLLHALVIIHSQNIAHQNLDDTNVLVNYNQGGFFNESEFDLRLIDFGMSCGFYNIPESQGGIVSDSGDSDNRDSDLSKLLYKNCLEVPKLFLSNKNMEKSVNSINSLIDNITKTVDNKKLINLAQKYDVWCCGIIIYDLIHCRIEQGINASAKLGYDNHISWLKEFKIKDSDNSDGNSILRGLKLYNNMVIKKMLVPVNKRLSAKDCLDHIMANQ